MGQNRRFTTFCDAAGFTTAIIDHENNILILYGFEWLGTPKPEEVEEVKKRVSRLISLLRTDKAKFPTKCTPTIGADIEYSIYDSDGVFHSATEFVADSQESEIGTDGNVETLEIRPKAEKDPLKLVDNIEDILRSIDDALPKGFDLLCGGGSKLRRATGTHIHFSGMSTDSRKGSPEELVLWFDTLLTDPIFRMCKGIARADDHYGRPGDYRCRNNHHGFPHEGFEWRVLPTLTINKKFTQGLFCLAYMIAVAYETGRKITFDENNFNISWYENLPMYDKYREYVQYFVTKLLARTDVSIPCLNWWFKKDFEKDKECDVEVVFANDEEGHLAIKAFTMFNPQKLYSRIVIWCNGDAKNIWLSEKCKSLQTYALKTLGFNTSIASPSDSTVAKYRTKSTLFVGIPYAKIRQLSGNSSGSRNRVKMYAQDIIKNI